MAIRDAEIGRGDGHRRCEPVDFDTRADDSWLHASNFGCPLREGIAHSNHCVSRTSDTPKTLPRQGVQVRVDVCVASMKPKNEWHIRSSRDFAGCVARRVGALRVNDGDWLIAEIAYSECLERSRKPVSNLA